MLARTRFDVQEYRRRVCIYGLKRPQEAESEEAAQGIAIVRQARVLLHQLVYVSTLSKVGRLANQAHIYNRLRCGRLDKFHVFRPVCHYPSEPSNLNEGLAYIAGKMAHRPGWFTSATYWLTADGELFRGLMLPERVVDVPCVERAVVLREKMRALGQNQREFKFVGARVLKYLHKSNAIRSWSSDGSFVERPDPHLGKSAHVSLIVPPFASRWDGHCCTYTDGWAIFMDESLKIIHCAASCNEPMYSWNGKNIAYLAYCSKQGYLVVMLDTAGNLVSKRGFTSPPTSKFPITAAEKVFMSTRAPRLAAVLSSCSIVLFTPHDNVEDVVLCHLQEADSLWSCTIVHSYPKGSQEPAKCHILDKNTILFTKRIDLYGAVRIRVNRLLICIETKSLLPVAPHSHGVVFWTLNLADLAENEILVIHEAIAVMDEIGATLQTYDELYLVRTILVGFVLEDALLTLQKTLQVAE